MSKKRQLYLTEYCLTPTVKIPHAGILCEDKKILGIGGVSAYKLDEPGLEVIPMTNCYAMPGLIDCHVHGGGGFDTEHVLDPDQHIQDLSRFLASHGVTSFLPTLVSLPREKIIQTVARLAEVMDDPMPGAVPCGMHIEGPFINPLKSGTQQRNACVPIDLGFAAELISAGNSRIKIMTFAPELEYADKLVEMMLDNGVIPSMGHSVADVGSTLRAIDAGAKRCTHLYNGLPPLHHRHSSITDIVLMQDDISVELILDGGHIEPRIVELTSRVKPKDKMIGVSNALQYDPQSPNGYYEKDGMVFNANGILAGTRMTLDEGWSHLCSYSHLPKEQAAACFTSNPAKDIGLITRGELLPGKRADITFFNSKTNQVVMTISNGVTIFKASENNE